MRILLYIAIGLSVGSLSGAMGIGGGVLLVPALIWLCHFDPRKAAGTSLAILVPPIGLPAAWRAFHDQRIDLEAAVWVAASFTVGAFFGAGLVKYIPELLFRLLFGLLMIFIAVRFMVSSDSEAANALAGITATGLALLGFLGLRLLGRRHVIRPDLGEQIRLMDQHGRGDPDYYI